MNWSLNRLDVCVLVTIALTLSACCGGGGTANNTPLAATFAAAALLPFSYENSAKAGEIIGSQPLPKEVRGGNAIAFGDFFRGQGHGDALNSPSPAPTATTWTTKGNVRRFGGKTSQTSTVTAKRTTWTSRSKRL